MISINMEETKTIHCLWGQNIVIGATLSGWIGNVQQEGREIFSLFLIQLSKLTCVILASIFHGPHGRGQGAIDQVARGTGGLVPVTIGCYRFTGTSGIDPPIRIPWDTIPMIGGRPSKTTCRHGRAGDNLVATG